MKLSNFLQAIEIISKNHSTKVVINHVKSGGQVSPVLESPTIHITDCVGSVVNNLMEAGYNLSMTNGMTKVDDFSLSIKRKS